MKKILKYIKILLGFGVCYHPHSVFGEHLEEDCPIKKDE